jgi:hypothetical protein
VSDLAIWPDSPDAEGYLELGSTPQGTLWKKHLITLNRPFAHPRLPGKTITLRESDWAAMKSNFDNKTVTDIVQVPVVGPDNKHTENPLANIGEVVDLQRQGDKVYAIVDARDEEASAKLGKTLLGASAFLNLNATNPQTAEQVGCALLHCAITNRPHLLDLEPWTQYGDVIAASAESYPFGIITGDVLMLAAPSAESLVMLGLDDDNELVLTEDDMLPDPDYGRPSAMDTDMTINGEILRLGYRASDVSRHVPFRAAEHRDYELVGVEHEMRQAARSAALSAPVVEANVDAAEEAWQQKVRLYATASGQSYSAAADELRAEARRVLDAKGWARGGERSNEYVMLCAVADDKLARYGDTLSLSAVELEAGAADEVGRYEYHAETNTVELAQSRVPANPKLPAEPDIDAYLEKLAEAGRGAGAMFGIPGKKREADSPRRLRVAVNTDGILPSQRVLLEYHKLRKDISAEDPQGSVTRHSPGGAAQRQAAETRELAGGRRQGGAIRR